jgi:hypothetical protein
MSFFAVSLVAAAAMAPAAALGMKMPSLAMPTFSTKEADTIYMEYVCGGNTACAVHDAVGKLQYGSVETSVSLPAQIVVRLKTFSSPNATVPQDITRWQLSLPSNPDGYSSYVSYWSDIQQSQVCVRWPRGSDPNRPRVVPPPVALGCPDDDSWPAFAYVGTAPTPMRSRGTNVTAHVYSSTSKSPLCGEALLYFDAAAVNSAIVTPIKAARKLLMTYTAREYFAFEDFGSQGKADPAAHFAAPDGCYTGTVYTDCDTEGVIGSARQCNPGTTCAFNSTGFLRCQ